MFSPMECYGHTNESFDGFFSKVKNAAKSAVKATRNVVSASPVGAAGRAIDLTSSKSMINRALPSKAATFVQKYSRQAVATSAAITTGGASVLLAQRGAISKGTFGLKTTMQGALTGAMIGGAVAGGKLASATKNLTAAPSSNVAESIPAISSSSSAPTEDAALAQTMEITGATEVPVTPEATTAVDAAQSAVASAAAGAPKKSVLPLAAAAGAGFLMFGPIGAVAGAAAGAFLGRKKA